VSGVDAKRTTRALNLLGLPRSAADLLPSLRASIPVQTTFARNAVGEFDYEFPIEVVIREAVPIYLARELLVRFNELCRGARADVTRQLVYRLRAMTVRRAHADDEDELTGSIYSTRLGEFPEDVVLEAVSRWIERETFFPPWAELRAEIDKRMRGRLAIREALQRYLDDRADQTP